MPASLPLMTGKSQAKSWGPSLPAGARRPRPGRLSAMRIALLAGGVGGARFVRGLRAAAPEAKLTVIGNTGDDIDLFGLHVSPDLDTIMYTLGGGISEQQGWGRDADSHVVQSELTAYGAGPEWFSLGDRDFATHIVRTAMLRAGLPLSLVTQRLCERWRPGIELLPMTDDNVRTHVMIDDDAGLRKVHFQEWWVRLHAKVPAREFLPEGASRAVPAPGVVEAITGADFVLLPPSNPVVSIGVILSVPGIAEAVRAKTVVGISPVIGGAPVRGMADACLTAIGVQTTATAVAAHYGQGFLDGWLVDPVDSAAVTAPELAGITVRAVPLYLSDLTASAAVAAAAIDLARDLAR
jgi:LPPG:FO 2-phospho-L-lactate transferase